MLQDSNYSNWFLLPLHGSVSRWLVSNDVLDALVMLVDGVKNVFIDDSQTVVCGVEILWKLDFFGLQFFSCAVMSEK